MKKTIFITLVMVCSAGMIFGQKYFTKEGKVSFLSDASVEKIEATTNTGTCVLDASSGKIEFAVLIKSFQFEKALMQEHFNENYMESSKFPKGVFKGQIRDWSKINLTKDGTYTGTATGALTIHGETNQVEVPVNFKVKNGTPSAEATFSVALADYKIEIPAVVADNIAKNVSIDVAVNLQELSR
jgi:polyisoprenoid-binding protein YceI